MEKAIVNALIGKSMWRLWFSSNFAFFFEYSSFTYMQCARYTAIISISCESIQLSNK